MTLDCDVIAADWPRAKEVSENWGDLLNPALIAGLANKPVVHVADIVGWQDRPVHRVIGSGLSRMESNHVIWGMGFIDNNSGPSGIPREICSVRGPRSRLKLIEQGINCPEVYGDPALLYPLIFYPDFEKKYEIGVIYHCRELRAVAEASVIGADRVNFIDITRGLQEVVRDILECNFIVSSSLHGIICAHSYGIPAAWMKVSDYPLGDGFKFVDYFESVGIMSAYPMDIRHSLEIHVAQLRQDVKPILNGKNLISACPFIDSTRKESLMNLIDDMSARVSGAIFEV